MHISYIAIKNFRNFLDAKFKVAQHAIILGENSVGKSNLIYALRLILDPSLPDNERQLTKSDFHVNSPMDGKTSIEITIRLSDVTHNAQKSVLTDCHNPDNREEYEITFRFSPQDGIGSQGFKNQYEFGFYTRKKKLSEYVESDWAQNYDRISKISEIRRRISIMCIPAIRDIETSMQSWKRSPIRTLVERRKLDTNTEFVKISDESTKVTENFRQIDSVSKLEIKINDFLSSLLQGHLPADMRLGLTPPDVYALSKTVKIFTGGDAWRSISDESVGISNVLYLALLNLELEEKQSDENLISILCIEEPEAHLHPHLQRIVFREYFQGLATQKRQIIVTTHSPNIAAVAPINALVLLKSENRASQGFSAVDIVNILDQKKLLDLKRYIDVTRSDLFFARCVILVEGIAEELLLPAFSKEELKKEPRLDQSGISVCNVEGVSFEPYVALLSTLGIPFVVITDGDGMLDSNNNPIYPGIERALKIAQQINKSVAAVAERAFKADQIDLAIQEIQKAQVFCNKKTLEAEMLYGESRNCVEQTFALLLSSNLFDKIKDDIDTYTSEINMTKDSLAALKHILSRIEDYPIHSKGRFAQTLSTFVSFNAAPPYIQNALDCALKNSLI